MASETTNYPQLKSRTDWHSWMASIADLAVSYDHWQYIDPDGAETTISKSEKTLTAIREVNKRITATIAPQFQVFYLDERQPRGKLQALRDALQPTTQD